MKYVVLATAMVLLLPAPIALADCASDTTEILKATAAAGPIRRVSTYLDKGTPDHVVTRDFSPPDQIKEISSAQGGKFVSTVLVSGKTAWSSSTDQEAAGKPPTEYDGSAYLPDTLLFRLPPAPATECSSDSAEIKLVWKTTDGKRIQQYTAWADAKTHVLIAVDGFLKDEKGNTEYEEHVRFQSIPAFTITPPAGAVKLDSGPTYAKIEDVDPVLPLPPEADKITYVKGSFVRFDSSQKVAALVEFYRSKYKAIGWSEQNPRQNDYGYTATFVDVGKNWISAEIAPDGQFTRVKLSGPHKKN